MFAMLLLSWYSEDDVVKLLSGKKNFKYLPYQRLQNSETYIKIFEKNLNFFYSFK